MSYCWLCSYGYDTYKSCQDNKTDSRKVHELRTVWVFMILVFLVSICVILVTVGVWSGCLFSNSTRTCNLKDIHNFIKSKTFWDRKTNLHYEIFKNGTAMDRIGNYFLILSHVWSKIFSQGKNSREKMWSIWLF